MNEPNHKQFHTLHVLINIGSSVKILQTFLQPVVNCPDSQVVRAARWKAKGRWFDSRRRHIFILNFALPISHSSAKKNTQQKVQRTFTMRKKGVKRTL